MKVYASDILVKSLIVEQEIEHLGEAFEILRKYIMKLNPAKCSFGFSFDQFLDFMVIKIGTEWNPSKLLSVVKIQTP